jgi:hypothetical protein
MRHNFYKANEIESNLTPVLREVAPSTRTPSKLITVTITSPYCNTNPSIPQNVVVTLTKAVLFPFLLHIAFYAPINKRIIKQTHLLHRPSESQCDLQSQSSLILSIPCPLVSTGKLLESFFRLTPETCVQSALRTQLAMCE